MDDGVDQVEGVRHEQQVVEVLVAAVAPALMPWHPRQHRVLQLVALALAPLRLYSQLAPALAGVGVAVCLQALVRAALELGLMMWFGQILFRLFYSRDQVTPDTKLFYRVLGHIISFPRIYH